MKEQDKPRALSHLGMLWGLVLGVVIGIVGSGPYFHVWSVSSILTAVLAVAVFSGIVGYFFIPILIGQIAGGSNSCAGGRGEDGSQDRQRERSRERVERDASDGSTSENGDWSD